MQSYFKYSHTINMDNTINRDKYPFTEDDQGNISQSSSFMRKITPIDDYSEEAPLTQALCNIVFTQVVKDKWLQDNPPYTPPSLELQSNAADSE